MKKLRIDWSEFETAIASPPADFRTYLNRETGAVLVVAQDMLDELQDLLADADPDTPVETVIAESGLPAWQHDLLLAAWQIEEGSDALIPIAAEDFADEHRDLADFTATVEDQAVRHDLERAIDGPGAFRRFRNVIHNTFRERQQWFKFQQSRQREKAEAWLAGYDIEVEWVMPKPPADVPARLPPREHLLTGVLKLTQTAAELPGVKRIALLGSLTRNQPEPKDADVLVTVSDEMDLVTLAKASRRLAGHAQQLNRGADVFLANERGQYIGRICPWRNCGPGFRTRCDALHCGQRTFLHDDLRDVTLAPKLVAEPPIELWPQVHARVAVPNDVERIVLTPLRAQP